MCPVAPKRPCRKPGCNVLGVEAYCEEHLLKRKSEAKKQARDFDQLRGTRTERGYDNRWLRYAAKYRRDNPLCVMCMKEGKLTQA